ncbi:MAG: PD40 domain-containing protein, partial [Armatimonadetes bacterium]|nr:PD40 domain-containing protein [Armatimonadota bacterium]
PAAGGEAQRIKHDGHDIRPRWSPDGGTLTFCSNKNGNYDLFLVPAAGGEPRQLTFHSADDVLGDWSPDGRRILFYSSRESRSITLYTIEVDTGRLHRLSWDDLACQTPAFSPDGKWVAYTRGGTGAYRRGYRGSMNADVWALFVDRPREPRRLTDWNGNDMFPFFGADGESVYYASEQDGAFNLWRTSLKGGRASQITHYRSGAVRYPSVSYDRRTVVYEYDFGLWTLRLDERDAQPRPVKITAAPDPPAPRETRTVNGGVNEFEISPDGSRVAFGAEGEIFVMPVSGGTPIRITDHPARDYDFSWHPDGRHLAFVSERDANVDLYLVDVETRDLKRLTTATTPETAPIFSPGGRWLAFNRGPSGQGIYVMPAWGGSERLVADGPFVSSCAWSPDSRWIAYVKRDAASSTEVWIAPVGGSPEQAVDVTRSGDDHAAPQFTPDGRQLLFLSDRSGTQEVYAVNLTRGTKPGASADVVEIDFTNIHRRARHISTQPAGNKTQYVISPDSKICYYVAGNEVWKVPLDGSTAPTRVYTGHSGPLRIAPDGAHLFYAAGTVRHVPVAGGEATNLTFSIPLEVDRAELRREAFDEAWRLLRDNFYDEKMHGADWDAVRTRYRPLVDECVHRDDWLLLLNEMLGELNASHLGASPAGESSGGTATAYLGVWFDYDYDGPGLKITEILRGGPAAKDEPLVQIGEYILSLDGKDVAANEALFQQLNGAAGRTIDGVVNSRPSREGARTIQLTLINRDQWNDLFYEHWVEERRATVTRLSQGRLAYMHIRAMNAASLMRFRRELRSEAFGKEGLVLDVRWNGGGRIHDDLFAALTTKVHVYETPRGGLKMTQPFGAFTGPIILLINQSSFSDAEIFPNGFRENNLGKIVGTPTFGGVIGTNNRVLLDGQTQFRVPQTGWITLDGRDLEREGVRPDILVENQPADIAAGRDPQLERAVRELLRQIRSRKRSR